MKIAHLIILLFPLIGFSQVIEEIQLVDTTFINKNELSLKGNLKTVEWKSANLNENRSITIYEPPNYNKHSSYGVLFVTDGSSKYLADDIEAMIIKKAIPPIIVVGLNLRESQPIDSILGNYKIDFRAKDYLKDEVMLGSEKDAYKNPEIVKLVSNRYDKYCLYVQNEVITYIKQHYAIKPELKYWTLGGYSNGGAFVYGFSTDYPNNFGNSIVMSPGMYLGYDILNSNCKYFLCAGTEEYEGFMNGSLEYIPLMQKNNIPFIHKKYKAGHECKMWHSFYFDSIKSIYN